MPTAKDLLSRYNRLRSDRSNWENVWQDIADNMLGRRDFQTERTPGEPRQQWIFDTTAQLAAELLSAALHALLTNPSSQWFALRPTNDRLLDDPEVMRWSFEAERVMRDVFESPKTGFATAMHEVYVDMPVFGTAGLWVEDRADGKIIFSARPLGELFLAENSAGRVDTVFRRFNYTARQATEEFKERAPRQAVECMRTERPDEKVAFLHALMPTPERTRPWSSYFVALQDQTIVSEGGFFSMPYMTPRWSKDVGEIYGRGPGWQCLPDAKMCNRMKESMLKAQQLAVEPPRLVPDDGCIFPLRLTPGAQNKYRADMFRTDPVQTLGYEGNYPIGEKALEMVQESIRQAFHSELLPLFQKPYMTATEVVELANQAQRFLSPTHGRLQVELLEPMIERVFDILQRQGALPDVPDILDGEEIRVVYVSPIAKAQKEQEVRSILETFSTAAQMAAVPPYAGVLDNLDPDAAIRMIAKLRGLPPEIVRAPRAVARQRQQKAQMEAAQQELAMAQQAAAIGKDAASAGSALAA